MAYSEANISEWVAKDKASLMRHIAKQYARIIFSALHNVIEDTHLCEDLAQEVLLRIDKSLTFYEERGKLGAWIKAIARNLALDELRKSKVETRFTEDLRKRFQAASNKSESPIDEEAFKADLAKALEALDPLDREVYRLKVEESMSYLEIAAKLGLTVGQVTGKLHSARMSLQTSLRRYCHNG